MIDIEYRESYLSLMQLQYQDIKDDSRLILMLSNFSVNSAHDTTNINKFHALPRRFLFFFSFFNFFIFVLSLETWKYLEFEHWLASRCFGKSWKNNTHARTHTHIHAHTRTHIYVCIRERSWDIYLGEHCSPGVQTCCYTHVVYMCIYI